MRIKDIVHFSPNYKYEYINLDDKNCLIEAFEDRVGGFYLKPIEILNDSIIQRFEYTYELSWKVLKYFLEEN